MGTMLTVAQAAERLNLAPITVRNLVKQGRLPACRLTRKLLIDEGQLERAVADATKCGTSATPAPLACDVG